MRWWRLGCWLLLGCLITMGPLAGGQAQVSLVTGEACDGLSEAECCAQTLKTHAFRAVGERLPERGRLVVDLACKQPQRKLPITSCRSLLVARGVKVGEAQQVCRTAGLNGRCKQRRACRKCVADMSKLGYRSTAPACLAATRVSPVPSGPARVIVQAEPSDPDGTQVTRRRTVLD